MLRVYNWFLICGLIISGCDLASDPTDPAGEMTLKGRVISQGQPVQGAEVSVGDPVIKASTDANGYFEIKQVPKGLQAFKALKNYDNNKVVFIKNTVAVEQVTTDIGELSLPSPLGMMAVDTTNINQSVLKVSWEKSVESDFTEYRVYRSNSAAIDETTGELLFATTNINITSFEDRTFRTGTPLYYRIYALASTNKFSGSNFVSVTVPGINLITNGSFETSSDGIKPNIWLYNITGTPQFDYFTLGQQHVSDGQKCLVVTYIDSLSNPPVDKIAFGSITQVIASGNLKYNEQYNLSFWAASDVGSIQVRLFKNGDTQNPIVNFIVPDGQAWQEFNFPFTYTSDMNYLELWINTKGALSKNGIVKAYVDNVRLMK